MFDAGTQMTIHQLASSHEHLCTCVGNKEKKRKKTRVKHADITAFSFIFEGPPLCFFYLLLHFEAFFYI